LKPGSSHLAALVASALLAASGAVSDSVRAPLEEPKSTAFVSAAVSANVVGALSIQKVQDLEFGDVRVPGGGGSVTVRPVGDLTAERTSGGDVVLAGTSFSAAQFAVSRSGGGVSRVEVTLPAQATLGRIGGGETVTVDGFVSTVVPGCSQGPCPASVVVGATVRIPPVPISGRYVGTFTVTVNAF
jgi:hypothetical protein